MQYNKVANLSSASLSTGDLEHYVYRNSQCSVWEVAKRRCVLSTERLYMLQISHRIKTRQVKNIDYLVTVAPTKLWDILGSK